MIPHYAVIANVIQMKQYADRHDAGKPNSQKKYAPGDRMLGGTFVVLAFTLRSLCGYADLGSRWRV